MDDVYGICLINLRNEVMNNDMVKLLKNIRLIEFLTNETTKHLHAYFYNRVHSQVISKFKHLKTAHKMNHFTIHSVRFNKVIECYGSSSVKWETSSIRKGAFPKKKYLIH